MQAFIRYVGVLNAAVWFGAVVFFTLAGGPAFFSDEMLSFLPRPYAGRAAEVMIGRLFVLQQGCAVIALLHLLVEQLYFGRRGAARRAALLGGLLIVNVLGGHWLLPRMHELERIRYAPASTVAEAAAAASRFGLWHGFSQVVNLLVIVSLAYYLGKLARPGTAPWSGGHDRFRG
jgi:hypothetical protein